MSRMFPRALLIAAAAAAAWLHGHRLRELPPGVCYDSATLAVFSAEVARGRHPFASLARVEGVDDYRRVWADATLPASAAVAGLAALAGIPPQRMERAELAFQAGLSLLACLLLAALIRCMTASDLLAAAGLVLFAFAPIHYLHGRAGPHLFAPPAAFWTAAALGLWLGRGRGRWVFGLCGWAAVGLSGLFFYASLAGLPLCAALLTWFGAEGGMPRKARLLRLLAGLLAALVAYGAPAAVLGWRLAGGDPLAVPRATLEFYLGLRGTFAPPGVPWPLLPVVRFQDLAGQVYGGSPPRHLFQAEVDMWVVPGRLLLPVGLHVLLAWALLRAWREGRSAGPGWLWAVCGAALPVLLVLASTSGEVRYVAPGAAFLVLAGVLGCRRPGGAAGEPGVLGRVFLLALVLLSAGEGYVTGFVAHAGNRFGTRPQFAGWEPVAEALAEETRGMEPGRARILAADYPLVRYHLALYSGLELCPRLGDLERLMPAATAEAIAAGRLGGRVRPEQVAAAARELGLLEAGGRLYLVGLSSDPRLPAVGAWCGLEPWRTFPHPFGGGLAWLVYRLP